MRRLLGQLIPRLIALGIGLAACAASIAWLRRLDGFVFPLPYQGEAVACVLLTLGTVAIACSLRGRDTAIGLILSATAAAASLFTADLLLSSFGHYLTLPSSYDKRSKLEVALDMRKEGRPAYPSVHPAHFVAEPLLVDGLSTIPVSGMAHTLTVFCNEVGAYYIYESDERGFKNPRGAWSAPVEIALLGDSFTQGYCIPEGLSYPELIRAGEPATLNVSQALSGPLIELAMAREFLLGVRPRLIYWFYFEGNDIPDLSRELSVPILKSYLEDPAHSQQLVKRERSVQQAIVSWMDRKIELESSASHRWSSWLRELPAKLSLSAKLWHVRSLAGFVDLNKGWPLKEVDWSHGDRVLEDAFSRVVSEMARLAATEGAELVFVYLPASRPFTHGSTHPWRERVLSAVTRAGVPVIDLLPIFGADPEPLSLFTIGQGIHYTERGNALVASTISDDAGSRKAAQPPATPAL